MKIIIKNSTVEFQTRDVNLYDGDVSFSTYGWKYIRLNKHVNKNDVVKVKIISDNVLLTKSQVKGSTDGESTLSSVTLNYNQFNAWSDPITIYTNEGFDYVGVYVNCDTSVTGAFPTTVRLQIELV